MQNKLQFESKCHTVINNLVPQLLQECLKLYDSGGVDTTKFPDDFSLPRIAVKIALERKADLVAPDRWLRDQKLLSTYGNLKRM